MSSDCGPKYLRVKRQADEDPFSPRQFKRCKPITPMKTTLLQDVLKVINNQSSSDSEKSDVNQPVSEETIAANIKDEMKRLQNRKQLYYSGSGNQFMLNSPNPEHNSNENEASTSTEGQSLNTSFLGLLSPALRDQPLFTFRQVTLICERLLKERETSLREEYDRVLSSKLAEQYDTFVKFTYDQIQKRFENGTTPSYLS